MCLRTRGRVPGPVGAPGGLRRGARRSRYVPGLSRPGPLGLRTSGAVLVAEAGAPVSDVVTDAGSAASVVELVEPEPVFGQPVALQDVNLPLFTGDPAVPAEEDVMQGALDNCPVAAILAALAHVAPESVAGMIARSTADVRSRRRSDPHDSFPYRTDRLYTVQIRGGNPVRVSSFLYYTAGAIAYAHSPDDRAAWMSYIEKAYAVFRGGNSYNHLGRATQAGEAPTTNTVMEDLAGPYDFADIGEGRLYRSGADSAPLSDAILRDMLAQADQRATITASQDSGVPENVVPNHAYTVLGRSRSTVSLRNPQGGSDAVVTFAFDQFKTIFRAVLQAAAGS